MGVLRSLQAVAVVLVLIGLSAPARAAETVTIGTVGSASANIWPVFIGLNKGFFAEADIKVELVYVQSSAQMIQQLTSGSLDVTMSTGLVDPIRAIQKGAPIAIVRLESQSPPYALVAKPDIKALGGTSRARPSRSAAPRTSPGSMSSACWRRAASSPVNSTWSMRARPRRAPRR